jgi:hypothetical protein
VYTYLVYDKDATFIATYVVALAPASRELWPLIVRRFPKAGFAVEVR